MVVVDAHVHIFPDEIIRHRERFCARDRWFADLYASERSRLASASDLLESMDDAGIDVSIACGFPWSDSGLCRLHNEFMKEAADTNPGRIAWMAIAPPADPTNATRLLEEALDGGAVGLGELNADAQGFDLETPSIFAPIAEICVLRNVPTMFHVSEPIGHPYPGKGRSTPQRLLTLLLAFPELRVVAAHWGGGLPFYELMPEVRAATTRVAYDSAASTYLYDPSVFETVTSLVGERRVMFASDFPVLKQAPILRKCRERPWESNANLNAVLGENAMRIYGLEEKLA